MASNRFSVMNYSSRRCFLSGEASDGYMSFTCEDLCELCGYLIDNIYVIFGSTIMRQVIGIPMGTDCAPLLADLFLHSYESTFMQNLMKNKTTFGLAKSFNQTDRYIDDLISLDNKKFKDDVAKIYPQRVNS